MDQNFAMLVGLAVTIGGLFLSFIVNIASVVFVAGRANEKISTLEKAVAKLIDIRPQCRKEFVRVDQYGADMKRLDELGRCSAGIARDLAELKNGEMKNIELKQAEANQALRYIASNLNVVPGLRRRGDDRGGVEA